MTRSIGRAAITRRHARGMDRQPGGFRQKETGAHDRGRLGADGVAALRGRAVDVAPDGFPHPAWRAGFALAVPVPLEVEA